MKLETTAKLASESPWCAAMGLGAAFLYLVVIAWVFGKLNSAWKAHLCVSLPFALFWLVVCWPY